MGHESQPEVDMVVPILLMRVKYKLINKQFCLLTWLFGMYLIATFVYRLGCLDMN